VKHKTHNYTRRVNGQHYVLEAAEGDRWAMTAQGRGVKPGDYLLLQEEGRSVRYQVEQIAYYAEPPDMWVALLVKLPPV
jgi:MioC protein